MKEPRKVIQQVISYEVVDYGRIRVKLAEMLDSRNITRNCLRSLTGANYEVITRYYKADQKRVDMVDLDFFAKVCYALDCKLEDLLEYVPPEEAASQEAGEEAEE